MNVIVTLCGKYIVRNCDEINVYVKEKLVALDYIIQLSVDLSNYIIVEMTTYIYIYIYKYIRTLISRIVPISVYKTVHEPIQQHTAVHYNNSWLR